MKQSNRLLLNHKKEARKLINNMDMFSIIRYLKTGDKKRLVANLPLLSSIMSARIHAPNNTGLLNFLRAVTPVASDLVAFYTHPNSKINGEIHSNSITTLDCSISGKSNHHDVLVLPEKYRTINMRYRIGFVSARDLSFERKNDDNAFFSISNEADVTIVPFEPVANLGTGKQMLIFANPPGFSEEIEIAILNPSALEEKGSNGWFGPVACISPEPKGKIISAAEKRRSKFNLLLVTDIKDSYLETPEELLMLIAGSMEDLKNPFARMAAECGEVKGDTAVVSRNLERILHILDNPALVPEKPLTFDTSAYE